MIPQLMIPQLMIPVEQAVRPVVASHHRKMQMREELYSLIEGRYLQQRDIGHSEQEAVASALLAFGSHHQLTQELQLTVPARERRMKRLDRLLAPREIPASLKECVRIGFVLSAPLVIFFLGCECVLWLMHHKNAFLIPQCLIGIALAYGLGGIGAIWLGTRSIVATRQGQTFQLALHGIFFSAWLTTLFGLLYLVSDVNFLLQSGWWRLTIAALAAIPVYLMVIWQIDKELRQSAPWNSLELTG